MQPTNQVAILDAGAQYGGLIDRSVRELGVTSDLLALDTPARQLNKYQAIIISGGPSSVNDPGAPQCDPAIFKLGKPILGICYGLQLMAKHLGGQVSGTALREDGPQTTRFSGGSTLFTGLAGKNQAVLMSHGDSVVKLPKGFAIIGENDGLISAIGDAQRQLFGTQFHPEVVQTDRGKDIFKNFLFKIAKLKANASISNHLQTAVRYIKDTVGQRQVVLFVSGGVDSSVLALLIAKALGPAKVHAFHIDTGFMRQNESQEVMKALKDAGIKPELIKAAKQFYSATTVINGVETQPLNKVTDPQTKRKIIGDQFMRIQKDIIRQKGLGSDTVLAQGSLRPDLIESGSHLASSKADTIKTHHNDTEAVRLLRAQGRVLEPLKDLYKDQVRQLGRQLGLPAKLVARHPFPGPGLAVRILCSQQPYRLPNHDEIQTRLDEFLTSQGHKDFTARLLPVQTVGVQGDGRSYKYLVGIFGKQDWPSLLGLVRIIPNNIHEVNRVCYVFGDLPKRDLSITPTLLTPDVLEQLRQAEAIATGVLQDDNLLQNMSQMPVILAPIDFDSKGSRAIALRPFKTMDFMTGVAAVPGKDIPLVSLKRIIKRITSEVPGISRVLYDLTSKPPGTTEWE